MKYDPKPGVSLLDLVVFALVLLAVFTLDEMLPRGGEREIVVPPVVVEELE